MTRNEVLPPIWLTLMKSTNFTKRPAGSYSLRITFISRSKRSEYELSRRCFIATMPRVCMNLALKTSPKPPLPMNLSNLYLRSPLRMSLNRTALRSARNPAKPG